MCGGSVHFLLKKSVFLTNIAPDQVRETWYTCNFRNKGIGSTSDKYSKKMKEPTKKFDSSANVMESGKINISSVGNVLVPDDEHLKHGDNGGNNKPDAVHVQQWNNSTEFLMSCIAMSVGLGNIWRFPFTAFENGRGAFLLAYLTVLVFIGRPLYYLELTLGQFSSKGCLKVWECIPLFKGIGYCQIAASSATLTYYCALMAITLFYFFASFSHELPWIKCKPEWDDCFDSSARANGVHLNRSGLTSSSELYFLKEVLHERDSIDDGIGLPSWELTSCLLLSWIILFLVTVKGVQSSGRASYFLAIFPYFVLVGLMIKGCTLPGASNGILFFIEFDWMQLLSPKVWYAAVTQAFFSLSISFGNLITYASYNRFTHNIHRDAMIVTILDTFTSGIAGVTIFSILGNLAYNSGISDITDVTKGGIGLAFISYPEATAKFDVIPQLFAATFFFMLYVLGVGSAISLHSVFIKAFVDHFPKLKNWKVALVSSVLFFSIGTLYLTPGGQYIINLVDFYAASFSIFLIACIEIIGISWIYGYKNICNDLDFMLKSKVGLYWKLCWGFFTPVIIIIILVYTLITFSSLKYGDYIYPISATVIGWIILITEILQIPFWAIYEIQKREGSLCQRISSSLRPSSLWGPSDPNLKKEWEDLKSIDFECKHL